MSAVDVPKNLHHDCHEGFRLVSMGSQGMQSWRLTQGSDEGTEKTCDPRQAGVQSQLEETVDEAIVVQVQGIPTVLDDLGLSSIKTRESTWPGSFPC